jgi:hypothetical protein
MDSKHIFQKIDKKIIVGLDIDGVLALPLSDHHEWVNLFKKNNLIIDVIVPHAIMMGVIQFLRYLDTKKIEFHFFSSGIHRRNEIFVKKLLILALGETRGAEAYKSIKIKSKNDLQKKSNKKDLKKILGPNEKLDSLIMIDDDKDNILFSQRSNWLRTARATHSSLYCMLNKIYFINDFLFSANQIFYVVGVLELLKLDHNKKMTQSLFEFQYEKTDQLDYDDNWLYSKGIVLLTFSDETDITKSHTEIKDISKKNSDAPIVIKINNIFYMYSKPNGNEWELSQVNKPIINELNFFPCPIEKSRRFVFKEEEDESILKLFNFVKHEEYRFSFKDNYRCKSLYLAGYHKLRQFCKKEENLFFCGIGANEFFGLEELKKKDCKETQKETPFKKIFFSRKQLTREEMYELGNCYMDPIRYKNKKM